MRRKLASVTYVSAIVGIAASVAVAASSPSVTTGSATSVADTHALLHGDVNPSGSATTYYFQWGPTTAYGINGTPKSAGSGTRTVAVSASATALIPGTKYHYRLVGQSKFGLSVGRDHTFKTPGHPLPGAVTGGASSITTTSAIVSGTVVTNGGSTGYYFQYGPAAGKYTMQTPGGSAPGSSTPTTVAAAISLLSSGTTIHYRLVVTRSGFSPIYGADAEFTTIPSSRPYPSVRASTSPSHAFNKPFTYTTSGTVSSGFPAQAACSGDVTVEYFFGSRRVAGNVVGVQSNCAFASRASFAHSFKLHGRRRAHERLRIEVTFLGNAYLAPTSASREHVFIR